MNILKKLWLSVLYFFSKKELTPLFKEAHHLKSFSDRGQWLERLIVWISWDKRLRAEFDDATLSPQASRLHFLVQVLEKHPEHRKAVGIQLWAILSESTSQELLSEVGLSRERGFFGELGSRLWHKLLPTPIKENDLSELFDRCFSTQRSADWMLSLPNSQVQSLANLVRQSAIDVTNPFPGITASVSEAFLILGAKTASVGLTKPILERSPKRAAHESPFIQFNESCMQLSRAFRERTVTPEMLANFREVVKACQLAIEGVLEKVETSGVSVHLVYDLESLQSWIRRATALVEIYERQSQDPGLLTRFLTDLAKDSVAKRSLRELLQENIRLLSRKIVERTGVSGEHYITKNFSDYLKMLFQAMGGGILTAFTTLVKYFISKQQFPLFFDGLFTGLNYAISFVTIQLFHFTLATKQPSMTAPNLAGKLTELEGTEAIKPFIDEVARITRSNFISILGNVGAVVPMALFVDKVYFWQTGRTVYNLGYAEHALHSLDPFVSLTIPFAILTGILLWAASVCAGWFENWVVYERIPEAIAGSRKLQFFLGKRGALKFGDWFLKQSAGFGGNISLGFLLSFTGVFGTFFGLHLEVRHVTLSAGSVAFSAAAMLQAGTFTWEKLAGPGVGIIAIGFFNVSTCFLLALYVASRARNVRKGTLRRLLWEVLITLIKRPTRFFFPTKSAN